MNTRYRDILRKYWGYEDFRGIQKDIIESIGSGNDTLGLMPTGGGKSITFQVPTMAQPGICIVVTPLIALMIDQVVGLKRRGIKATAVYSGMTHNQILTALENCILGDYKFLYISPERISTTLFQAKLRHMKVCMIAVDEAHCISQWGYDFRPSYLQIAEIRKAVPNAPVLALTASATPAVVDDIRQQLRFREGGRVCRMSFERKNLTYIVRKGQNKLDEMMNILSSVPGSAIIYTRNRQQTHELADFLVAQGLTATNYHAGLPQVKKDERQKAWQTDEYRIMVATNAFGMGIDKPDVRLVLHYEIPDSPEAYFQEAGRAGRDGERAYAVMLYDNADCRKLLRRVDETYPEPDYIRRVYEEVCCYLQIAMGDGTGVTREFNLQAFCYSFRHFPVQAYSALYLLDKAGFIRYVEDEEIQSRLMFTVSRDRLYLLKEQPEVQERIIQCLLRNYPGIFSGYVYIDEYLLGKQTSFSYSEIYLALKLLDHANVLSYIPRKRINYITFVTRRVEKDEVILPPHVYINRRQQYEQRISAMIQYVTDEDTCHSQFLLRYFGEADARPCGHCEVCRQTPIGNARPESIRDHIRQQLLSGPLPAIELDHGSFDPELFSEVIHTMFRNGELLLDGQQRIVLP